MKSGARIRAGMLALAAALAGCTALSSSPSQEEVCGTSVSCGNPPKVAELAPSDVNACVGEECLSGSLGPTKIRIGTGPSLTLKFKFPPEADSPRVSLYLYAAGLGAGYSAVPLAGFESLAVDSFHLAPHDLDVAIRAAMPDSLDPELLEFNIFARITPMAYKPGFAQTGLLAGLGLDIRRGQFITAKRPSWGDDSVEYIGAASRYFQGKVGPDSMHAELAAAASAEIFIPGSPYRAPLDLGDFSFKMEGLPMAGFELRMTVTPAAGASRRVPVYRLGSAPGSGPDRIFAIIGFVDSVTISSDIP